MKTPALTATLALATTPLAHAHTGHHGGDLVATLWHMITQPDHMVMAAAGALAGIIAVVLVRRRA